MTDLPAAIRIVWPPRGLESSQGILWKKARTLGLGGALLTLPYLAGIAFPQPFNSLGLFGATWWVRSLAGLIGLLVVTWGMGGLVGFFLRAKAAADQGIGLRARGIDPISRVEETELVLHNPRYARMTRHYRRGDGIGKQIGARTLAQQIHDFLAGRRIAT